MSRSKVTLSIYHFLSSVTHWLLPNNKLKLKMEYFFWWWTKLKEKKLSNWHYEEFYTKYFGLEKSFYADKKILDIGCGPRGSLAWATNASTYGIDPLMDKYKKLGLKSDLTNYLTMYCESLNFDDNFFDVVSSFNSLDHVDDLQKSISEIKRVLKPGGTFLLIADIHHTKTICEPSSFSWDIVSKFEPEFTLTYKKELEGDNMYQSIRKGIKYNHQDNTKRYGILMALFIKNE